ncbi:ABC-2 type transport system permease protein [Devosia crocina]|uniref:ABC-2 type transport system permease protein n=1 Tax=Devosia crocina TaxID=429728 RepID=A0A1I7NV12_9HYPH|nr:ABC transporter permease [Devosia crocina]SFV38423.1 ABC-2 type transport system permease protein [Devosia crocina]
MIFAMLRVMTLSLLRDRGALAMAFLLPPTIFVIFAAIFSGAAGDQMRLQVALAVTQPSALTERLETALRAEPSLRILDDTLGSAAEANRLVDGGQADVGLVLAPDLGETATSPVLVLVDPAKILAGAILSGQVQRLIGLEMPDLALARSAPAIESIVGGFTPEQSARLSAAIAELGVEPDGDTSQAGLVETRTIGPEGSSTATITYYAGAVAILFLLFSAMQSSATLIEERHSGIVDRVAVGPAGTDVVVLGKFLFLTVQGVVQVALIFLVAGIVYGVDVLPYLPLWLLTSLAAALAASGLGLAVAASCTTKQQAHTIATFIVLVCSAMGGSMVPRFMMPPWLQDIGWYTPNAWTIEAYHGVLWRGETLPSLLPELCWLVVVASSSVLLALLVSRLRLRL